LLLASSRKGALNGWRVDVAVVVLEPFHGSIDRSGAPRRERGWFSEDSWRCSPASLQPKRGGSAESVVVSNWKSDAVRPMLLLPAEFVV
jgi:hypothetical protein